MKNNTKVKLLEAWRYCDVRDKSTEFMLEFMQSHAGVDLDCVLNFIQSTTDEERESFAKRNFWVNLK